MDSSLARELMQPESSKINATFAMMWDSRITPELSRTAKRFRLERIVRAPVTTYRTLLPELYANRDHVGLAQDSSGMSCP